MASHIRLLHQVWAIRGQTLAGDALCQMLAAVALGLLASTASIRPLLPLLSLSLRVLRQQIDPVCGNWVVLRGGD